MKDDGAVHCVDPPATPASRPAAGDPPAPGTCATLQDGLAGTPCSAHSTVGAHGSEPVAHAAPQAGCSRHPACAQGK
eukprot:gene8620-biopygen13686